jgi:hypothetical protein
LCLINKNKKESNMGWAEIVGLLLKLTPYVVAGVDVLHQGSNQATKTQKVQEILGVAIAAAAAPGVLSTGNAALAQGIGGSAEEILSAVTTKVTGAALANPTPVTQVPGSIPPA